MSNQKNVRFKWSLFAVSLLLGTMLTIQFSSKSDRPSFSGDIIQTKSALAYEVDAQKEMRIQIDKEEKKLQDYQDSEGNREEIQKQMASELERVRQQAGLTRFDGNGIEISIKDDPQLFLSLTSNQSMKDVDYHVFDVDLQQLVNILFANGAQALSINGQRIVTTTSIREVGSVMQINTVPISMPYEFHTVGDVDRMKSAITTYDLKRQYAILAKDFIVKEYRDASRLQVPAFEKPREFHYVTEDTEGGNTK